MDLCSRFIFSKNNKNYSKKGKKCNCFNSCKISKFCRPAGVCKAYTKTKSKGTWYYTSTTLISILCLCSPVRAQYTDLGWINPSNSSNNSSGESVNITTPSGHSCRYTSPKGPELVVGGAVIPVPNDYQPTNEPVVGIGIRIPLGVSHSNCDNFIAIEESTIKLQSAIQMYEMGLITKDQLMMISNNTFDVISK